MLIVETGPYSRQQRLLIAAFGCNRPAGSQQALETTHG